MKKILLLTGISAISIAAYAAFSEPVKLDDAFIQQISPNGRFAVSNMMPNKISIYDFETGDVFSFVKEDEYSEEEYYFGIGSCISNDGVLVGGQTSMSAEYCKNGVWYPLEVGEGKNFSNSANAITPDGSRICGMLGTAEFSYSDDVLMVVPCIWNAEGDGYGDPVKLPYPEFDLTGRVPQYIKAIDITADGKCVIGMITDATGRFYYPILYKENEKGEWSYEIPYEDLLAPADFKLPENPGDFKMRAPSYEDYLTPAELQEYIQATNDYYQNGDYEAPYPEPEDFMTPENAAEYQKVTAEYNEAYQAWDEKFDAYQGALDELGELIPAYQDNSVRISADGKSYGCTIQMGGGFIWGPPAAYHVWVFDLTSKNIVKYEQQDNLCLTYLADGNVALASTPVSFMSKVPSNSFVLKDGEVTGMYDYLNTKAPELATWMKQNMEFEYEDYDEDNNEVVVEALMTGHAVSNPDLSIMALSVENIGFIEDPSVWEDLDFEPAIGYGYIFDLRDGNSVESVLPVSKEKTIYDLYGRKLNEASAPGIYIINGEKKVVR